MHACGVEKKRYNSDHWLTDWLQQPGSVVKIKLQFDDLDVRIGLDRGWSWRGPKVERRADRDWARTFGREGAALGGADFRILLCWQLGSLQRCLLVGHFWRDPCSSRFWALADVYVQMAHISADFSINRRRTRWPTNGFECSALTGLLSFVAYLSVAWLGIAAWLQGSGRN